MFHNMAMLFFIMSRSVEGTSHGAVNQGYQEGMGMVFFRFVARGPNGILSG